MGSVSSSRKKVKVIRVAEANKINDNDDDDDGDENSDDQIDENGNESGGEVDEDELSLNSDNTIYLTSLLEDYSKLVTDCTLQQIKKFMKGYVGFARLSMPTISTKIKSGELNIRRSPTFRTMSPVPIGMRNAYSIYGSGSARLRRSVPRINLYFKAKGKC